MSGARLRANLDAVAAAFGAAFGFVPFVPRLVRAAFTGRRDRERTLATIRRSLRLSLAYNLVAGGLAVAGIIHPLVAALLMPASSLTVLASSLRSRAFR